MGRAIVRDPKCFLMDEPLSNLDAKLRVQMRTEVARIQRRLGTTMVYVTHDQTEAMTLGDRVAVMRAGIIQQVDSPATLYDDPVNLFVAGFIGSPSMNFLPGRLDGDKLELPFGTAEVPGAPAGRAEVRRRRRRARDVIVGARPEHFEDATIEPDRPGLMKFKAKIDVVESMGSELYVYFDVDTEAGGPVRRPHRPRQGRRHGGPAERRRRPARGRAPGLGLQGHRRRRDRARARHDGDQAVRPRRRPEPDLQPARGNGAGAKAASAASA